MYDYFKRIQSLENFNKLEKPITDYQRNIQDGNISPIEMWLKQFVIDYEDHEVVEALGSITFNKFNNWKEINKVKFEVSSAKLGVILSNLNIPGIEKGRHTNKGDTKYYNIKLLKKHFKIGCLIQLGDKNLKSCEKEDEEPQYN